MAVRITPSGVPAQVRIGARWLRGRVRGMLAGATSGSSQTIANLLSDDVVLALFTGTRTLGDGSRDLVSGDIAVHVNIADAVAASLTDGSEIIMDWTNSELEASNVQVQVEFNASTVFLGWEAGGGTNYWVTFTLATNITDGLTSFVSLYRTISGGTAEVRAYQDGVQLSVASVSGLTDNTTYASGTDPSGGTGVSNGPRFACGGKGLGTGGSVVFSESPPAAASQLADHNTQRTNLGNATVPETVPTGSWALIRNMDAMLGRGDVTISQDEHAFHAYIESYNGSGTGTWLDHAESGETSGTNYQMRYRLGSTSVLDVFWESGSGTNRQVTFTLDTTLTLGYEGVISVYRKDDGAGNYDVYAFQDGTQLNTASVNGGTDNTTYATLTQPSGGNGSQAAQIQAGVDFAGSQAVQLLSVTVPADASAMLADHDAVRDNIAALADLLYAS